MRESSWAAGVYLKLPCLGLPRKSLEVLSMEDGHKNEPLVEVRKSTGVGLAGFGIAFNCKSSDLTWQY